LGKHDRGVISGPHSLQSLKVTTKPTERNAYILGQNIGQVFDGKV